MESASIFENLQPWESAAIPIKLSRGGRYLSAYSALEVSREVENHTVVVGTKGKVSSS